MHPFASTPLAVAMTALVVFVLALCGLALRGISARRTLALFIAWAAVAGVAAWLGVFRFGGGRAMIGLMVGSVAAGIALGRSAAARAALANLPLWVLVLAQGFRLPLELVMHAAANAGVMPRALSYGGYNFDIICGAAAIVCGLALRWRASSKLAWVWLVAAWLSLANIALIVLLTSPMIHFWKDDLINWWVTYVPFVWLPAVLVAFAVAGQIAIFRKLRAAEQEMAMART